MTAAARRVALLILAASAAYVGAWAVAWPAPFFRSFPGAGHHWTAVDGPYNEHLVRDVGGLYLALFILSLGAATRVRDTYLVRLTAAAWIVFSVAHLAYHLGHLHIYSNVDRTLNVIALGGTLLLALVLLLPLRRSRR